MWWSVLIGLLVLNAMLFIVQAVGPKGIILTWIPGRTLLLIISLLHKPELYETLQYSWASGLVPVIFLVTLHAGTRMMDTGGRLPRFKCATKQWLVHWALALAAMTGVILLIGFVSSSALYIALGGLAVALNVLNIIDAPQHLQQGHFSLTIGYIAGVNVLVLSVLVAMSELLDAGELVWAGVIANVPLFAFILMIGSSCQPSPVAIRTTGQHIYMVSYQIWPNLTFIGVLWASGSLGNDVACAIAASMTVVVLAIQYIMIRNIL